MAELDARLADLRQRFILQTAADASRLRASFAAQDWEVVRAICHSLSGRAGMFGFAGLGEAAGRLEQAIEQEAAQEALNELADHLLEVADRLPQGR